MSSTKKVKSTGRFGSRYGVGIRKRVLKVEQAMSNQAMACPQCGHVRIHRLAAGIFECRKCDGRFAGGAYYAQTLTGNIVSKMVNQKSFLPNLGELVAAAEATQKQLTPLEFDSPENPDQAKDEKNKKSE